MFSIVQNFLFLLLFFLNQKSFVELSALILVNQCPNEDDTLQIGPILCVTICSDINQTILTQSTKLKLNHSQHFPIYNFRVFF